jgi:hypothetical protein
LTGCRSRRQDRMSRCPGRRRCPQRPPLLAIRRLARFFRGLPTPEQESSTWAASRAAPAKAVA